MADNDNVIQFPTNKIVRNTSTENQQAQNKINEQLKQKQTKDNIL